MFDKKGFMKASFIPRTEKVSVPGLSDWFKEEEPVWEVRGQTAEEMARCAEAGANSMSVENILKAISTTQEQVAEIKKTLGLGDKDTPADIKKRLTQLTICSVTPEIDMSIAAKLAQTFPVEFYIITNKIVELTGRGMDLKK